MAGLGALADLELDHLDLVVGRDAGELLRIEGAVGAVAATEIARPDLPDDVAAVFAVIGADAALPGIVCKTALFRAGVQGTHRVRAERAETHRGDIEHRCRIGFGAIRTADGDAEFFRCIRPRRHRMMHPFVALGVDVLLGAERPLVEHHFRALVDQRAGIAAERHAVLLALEEILPHLRPDLLEQEADMRRDRIVSQDRVILLQQIAEAQKRQAAEDQDRDDDDIDELVVVYPDADQQHRHHAADRENDEARRERSHQRFHGIPRGNSVAVLLFFPAYTNGSNLTPERRQPLRDAVCRSAAKINGCGGAARPEYRFAPARPAPARYRWSGLPAQYDPRSAKSHRASRPAGIAAARQSVRFRDRDFPAQSPTAAQSAASGRAARWRLRPLAARAARRHIRSA